MVMLPICFPGQHHSRSADRKVQGYHASVVPHELQAATLLHALLPFCPMQPIHATGLENIGQLPLSPLQELFACYACR